MPRSRAVPVIRYSFDLPPRHFWKISVSISRSKAGSFCEQLHAQISERGGASFYYPSLETDRNLCRYEWHMSVGTDRHAFRLGVVIDVGQGDLDEVEAYVTPASAYEHMELPAVELPDDVLPSANADVVDVLNAAIRGSIAQEDREWFVVLHIEVPYQHGFAERFRTSDGQFTILGTRILKDKNRRVSAVICRTYATTREMAKANALKDLSIACALMTLANNQLFEVTHLTWSRSRPAIQFVDSPDLQSEERFYERRLNWPPLEDLESQVGERFDWIWSCYRKLNAIDQSAFLPPLFAYYAASTRKKDHSTLSVVGFTAALSSLSKERRTQCIGDLKCSECGDLSWKHDLVGDLRAIKETIEDTCELEVAQAKEISDLLRRVYREQRSAYVHGAQLRHQEYGQGSVFPPHLPTNDSPVQGLFRFVEDLLSLAKIVRRTLLSWLAKRVESDLSFELFALDRDRVTARLLHTISFSSTTPSVIVVQQSQVRPDEQSPARD